VTTAAAQGRTRIGSYALCLDSDGRVLLCRIAHGYPAPGVWTLPGGGLDFGEHPDAGLMRELDEETGLVGRIDDLLVVHSHLVPAEQMAANPPLHSIGIIYRVSIVGSTEPRVEVNGSTDACGWFSPGEVRRLPVTSIVREALAAAGVLEEGA
jgi:ADP-ribose pyrophosphatase YjhB (NUDIX family)